MNTAAQTSKVLCCAYPLAISLIGNRHEKAFSYAAPELRKSIGSSAAFMAMVKNSYPVVYRPASVVFLKAEGSGDDVVQKVQMLDASGTSYLAVYSLQRQKDKTWRISGCAVVENKGRMA